MKQAALKEIRPIRNTPDHITRPGARKLSTKVARSTALRKQQG